MQVAVISDIHANFPALTAVLGGIDETGVDEIWCLGDLVGYGPDPDACVAAVNARAAVCLAGNHDMVVTDAIDIAVFASDAGTAARWTAATITAETMAILRELSPSGERAGVELYHASIRDPVWEYVIDNHTAAVCLELQSSQLALIGHSHVPLLYGYAGGEFVAGLAPADTEMTFAGGPFLLNPGSVGQPRDGDPRAAYLLLDFERETATWKRVTYDIAATQKSIAAVGLPRRLGTRLNDGR
jgi:predicted phosphodiesterase